MSEYAPFKMKGSPMQRNFGIGSALKQVTEEEHLKSRLQKIQTEVPFTTKPDKMKPEPEPENGGSFKRKLDAPKVKKKDLDEPIKEGETIPTVDLPENLKGKLPTKEEQEANKGTLKGLTQFQYDRKKVRSKIQNNPVVEAGKTIISDVAKQAKGFIDTGIKGGKEIHKYFTKK